MVSLMLWVHTCSLGVVVVLVLTCVATGVVLLTLHMDSIAVTAPVAAALCGNGRLICADCAVVTFISVGPGGFLMNTVMAGFWNDAELIELVGG